MTAVGVWASRVCGIGDEAAPDLVGQLELHRDLGLSGVELRTIDGRGLHELRTGEVDDLCRQVAASGLRVPVLDTPIGNWSTSVGTDLDTELSVLDRTAAVAHALNCRWLRVMSYPTDGRPDEAWAAESLRRMRLLTDEARRLDVVLLHENCQGWAGASAANTLRLLDHVDSPHLRLIFDVGNGLAYGYQAEEFLAEVLPFVEHVHIKNGHRDPDGQARFTLPDSGELDLAACIRRLEAAGYRGWYSLEPHVAHIPHLQVSGDAGQLAQSYRSYATRFRPIVEAAVRP
ncbi:sugar phosphate isomerase/epimerase family protein [Micromonospora sp. FIMYZ51]|uniref:sugar phosphate isomerase/epimerase family protein n=1 Tax=Micromonospora sp. FIMYZ51 TaxID=3051832 RepID=UPI00311E8D5C